MKRTITTLSFILICAAVPYVLSAQGYVPKWMRRFHNGSVQLSLVLPFSSGIPTQDSNSLDFYKGALMAARQAGIDGVDVDLDVVDCSNGLPDNFRFSKRDIVVGPIRYEALKDVIGAVDSTTLVVSPLDRRADSLLAGHTNFIQMAPRAEEQYRNALEWAREDCAGFSPDSINVILISTPSDSLGRRGAMEALGERMSPCKECRCGMSGDIEGWEKAYSKSGINIVIIATSNEAVMNNAIRSIGTLKSLSDNIMAFIPEKIRSFDTTPVEVLHRAGARNLSPYYIDYNDPRTIEFIHSYRALYNSEPSQFACQGYDVVLYMLLNYEKLSGGESDSIGSFSGFQISVRLQKSGDGGLSNRALRRIVYEKDFSARSAE